MKFQFDIAANVTSEEALTTGLYRDSEDNIIIVAHGAAVVLYDDGSSNTYYSANFNELNYPLTRVAAATIRA